ncbi:tetratricopeptide repeat protein [Polynucleobacter sp. JS-Mosq-20-D10]|uniref:tetratricopeptide repeat protein n=1 Tax=Polynucleobacter sp. JS-Mosq-20-D10 TaxID=2576922 RepID=UPI001BFD1E4C|nr:tetratricopeptide repeat protein [Polynucleobacter sp. JS-Mosq-20-D10]QWE00197.1 tetratricopeptide repeat protein [Polynucleobacter sp. JS-Mosq-20-D10]
MNPQLQTVLQQAIQAFQGGNFDGADLILQEVLQNDINNADSVFELGIAYAKANRFMEASAVFSCLQAYKNDDVRIPYNLGLIHSLQGKHQFALAAYDLALKIKPDDVDVLVNKGSTCNDIKNYVLALDVLKKAIQLRPDIPEAWSNKGIALNNLNLYLESINAYNEAIKLAPSYHEAWSNKSVPLNKLKRFLEASEACDKALTLKPDYAEAWMNKGVTLQELKRYDEAIAHYDKALTLKPDYAEAWMNKGVTLQELKRYDEAIAHYDKALTLKPDYAEAWTNKGASLHELKRYDEAIAHDEKALSLKPDIDWVSGYLLHTKMKICSWLGLAESLEDISKKIVANEKVTNPFPLLALTDNASLHKQSAEIYIQSRYPFNPVLGSILKRPQSQKIRVGYFSADFHNHATGYLMAELFELHDKSQFELVGFSFGPIANDEMRQRLEKSFDQFIEVGRKSDVEVAKLSRDLNIDIAVDLKGFTQDARTGIFSYRAAPIQVNYLGYPGTMGADYIDYIIADKTLIPLDSQPCYSEKVIYLPNSYQVNDRKRFISDGLLTRQELGLPEHGFVFCCFNNNYKILPETFDGWMRILKAVEGSVLWLFQDNSWASENLKKEADKQGIAADRLVFAERLPLSEHLARHRQADLFLDTLPYNAHTTTSDALWCGLPVLTLMGESFASRVSASLLNAIALPELITTNQEEYESLAIDLAMNPNKLADIKNKLANNRLTTPLFDTSLFTKNIEAAYIKMMERYQADLKLDHISIAQAGFSVLQ